MACEPEAHNMMHRTVCALIIPFVAQHQQGHSASLHVAKQAQNNPISHKMKATPIMDVIVEQGIMDDTAFGSRK